MRDDQEARPEPPDRPRRTFQTGSPVGEALWARWFQALYETPLLFSGILDAHGVVLDANQLAIEGCGLVRDEVLGQPFWECGWWAPDPDVATPIRAWCQEAIATGEPFRRLSRYFLGDGTERIVDLAFSPVRSDEGEVYLVATGLDVTDALATQREREERARVEVKALRKVDRARQREIKIVQHAERRADERLNRLVTVALDLLGAETIEDLTDIVVDRALPVLGADGGAVVVRDTPDAMRLAVSGRLGARRAAYRELPFDSPLPGPYTARTGKPVLLPSRAAGLAFSPAMAEAYEDTGRHAWAALPLCVGDRLLGSLVVAWPDEREFSDDEVFMLEAFAAQCAQALDRIRHLQTQREMALAAQRLSESLQRSLLTQPRTPDVLDIAVRYQPASHAAQIGGDWYDAFVTAAGDTMLAVGDVTGHDREAAAAMGQIRNVLRGLSYDSNDSPAVLLSRLDMALRGLEVGSLATAVLARVQQDPGGEQGEVRRLHWSNAGHPPPLLRQPDGKVHILDVHDPLLGLNPGLLRREQAVDLDEGSVLVLYTDGLIERRHAVLDEGIARLATALEEAGDRHPEQLCDLLLKLAPAGHEDDIALLVVRCGPVQNPA